MSVLWRSNLDVVTFRHDPPTTIAAISIFKFINNTKNNAFSISPCYPYATFRGLNTPYREPQFETSIVVRSPPIHPNTITTPSIFNAVNIPVINYLISNVNLMGIHILTLISTCACSGEPISTWFPSNTSPEQQSLRLWFLNTAEYSKTEYVTSFRVSQKNRVSPRNEIPEDFSPSRGTRPNFCPCEFPSHFRI